MACTVYCTVQYTVEYSIVDAASLVGRETYWNSFIRQESQALSHPVHFT